MKVKINYFIISLILLLAISCKKKNKPHPTIIESRPVIEEKGTKLIFGISDKMDTLSYRDIVKENYDKGIFKSMNEEKIENPRMLLSEDIPIDLIIDSLEIECFLRPIFIKGRNLTEVELYADSDSRMNIRSKFGLRKSDFRESILMLKNAYLEKYTILNESSTSLVKHIELTDGKRRINLSINARSLIVSYKSEEYLATLASLEKQARDSLEKALELEKDSLKKEFIDMKNQSEFFKKEI